MPKIVDDPDHLSALISTRVTEESARLIAFAAQRRGCRLSEYARTAIERMAADDAREALQIKSPSEIEAQEQDAA